MVHGSRDAVYAALQRQKRQGRVKIFILYLLSRAPDIILADKRLFVWQVNPRIVEFQTTN